MRWNYIARGELPELGDVCLIFKRLDGFYVGTFFFQEIQVIVISNIDEIKDAVECDDDGREHDYEMFPAQLYVTDIKCDPENGETEYSLKSKTIKVDYANKDDDERLFDAAKRRVPVVAEFKYVGRELHIRNVKIVEREDES